jgi:LSD1 subclass zinc finger protein
MAIQFKCSGCGRALKASDDKGGKKARCPSCGAVTLVPESVLEVVEFTEDQPLELSALSEGETIGLAPQAPPPPPPSSPFAAVAAAPAPQALPGRSIYRSRPKGDFGRFGADLFKAFPYGLRAFGTILAMILVVGVVGGLAYVGLSLFGLALLRSIPGVIVFAGLAMLLSLCIGGYVGRYYLDVIYASIDGDDPPPTMPTFDFGEVLLTGLRMWGISLVYIGPIITLPLLPLGLLGMAYTGDGRGLNIIWAVRAAFRRPGQLVVLWLVLLLWLLAAGVIVMIMGMLTAGAAAALVAAIKPTEQWSAVAIVGAVMIIGSLLIYAAVLTIHVVNCRCIGRLGYHFGDIFDHMPPSPNGGLTFAFFIGGAIGTVLGQLVMGALLVALLMSAVGGKGLPRTDGVLVIDDGPDENYRPPQRISRPAPRPTISTPPRGGQPETITRDGVFVERTNFRTTFRSDGYTLAMNRYASDWEVSHFIDAVVSGRDLGQRVRQFRSAKSRLPSSVGELYTPGTRPIGGIWETSPNAGRDGNTTLFVERETYVDQWRLTITVDGNVQWETAQTLLEKMARAMSGGRTGMPTGSAVPSGTAAAGRTTISPTGAIATSSRATITPTGAIGTSSGAVTPSGTSAARTFARATIFLEDKEYTRIRKRLGNLRADIADYARQHDGNFPASLDALRASGCLMSEDDLRSIGDKDASLVYITNQSGSSPESILLYDPHVYNGNIYLLEVSGALQWTSPENLSTRLARQDPSGKEDRATVNPSARPASGPASQPARATFDALAWNIPETWKPARIPDRHALEKVDGRALLIPGATGDSFARLNVGPSAKDRNDPSYVKFKASAGGVFDEMVAQISGASKGKPTTQRFGDLEYDRLVAFSKGEMLTCVLGVENGQCVGYWFTGTSRGFGELSKIIGKSTLNP